MDKKDFKILKEICENARVPLTKLAKKTNISRENLFYRLKKLERNEIIKGYQARLNIARFSHSGYFLLIKCQKTNEKIDEIIKNLKFVTWASKLSGEWDYLINFYVKSFSQLNKFLSYLFNRLKNIQDYSLLIMLKEYKDDFRPYFNEKGNKKTLIEEFSQNKIKIDYVNKKILKILNQNARLNSVEIANKINKREEVVRYRIKKLEKEGIIIGYRAIIDSSKLNYNIFYILGSRKNITDEEDKKIEEKILNNNSITYACRCIGKYDLIIEIFARTVEEFYKKFQELCNEIKLIETSSNILLNVYKHNHLPDHLLQ